MKIFLSLIVLFTLAACQHGPQADGTYWVYERSAALGNQYGDSSLKAPAGSWLIGNCNPDDVCGCTKESQFDKTDILTAAKAGKLYTYWKGNGVHQVKATASCIR